MVINSFIVIIGIAHNQSVSVQFCSFLWMLYLIRSDWLVLYFGVDNQHMPTYIRNNAEIGILRILK